MFKNQESLNLKEKKIISFLMAQALILSSIPKWVIKNPGNNHKRENLSTEFIKESQMEICLKSEISVAE